MRERDLGKAITMVTLAAFGAACTPEPTRDATPGPTETPTVLPSKTPTPSETPSPTSTRTPTLTPTITLSPTPNWEATNFANLDRHIEGESLELINIQVDEILIVNPIGIKELIYGVIRDEENSVRYIIENFDCEFEKLRDEGRLGQVSDEGFLWKRWDIGGILFERITVTKTTEFPGARFFTSESYELEGESEVCSEEAVLEPLSHAVRDAINWARSRVIRLTEGDN